MNSNDEKILEDLGKKLKVARENAGLTQLELAKKSGINANYYAVVERGEGNLSYEKLQRVLKVLNIKSLDISWKLSSFSFGFVIYSFEHLF